MATRLTETNAQAIVTAVNSTYKKGLDPEAYEGSVEQLEIDYELWVSIKNDVRSDDELTEIAKERLIEIKSIIKKARINE